MNEKTLRLIIESDLLSALAKNGRKCDDNMLMRAPYRRDLTDDERLLPPDLFSAFHKGLLTEEEFCERMGIDKKEIVSFLLTWDVYLILTSRTIIQHNSLYT